MYGRCFITAEFIVCKNPIIINAKTATLLCIISVWIFGLAVFLAKSTNWVFFMYCRIVEFANIATSNSLIPV